MSSVADRVVRFAAALLPSHVRSRYREQWLGELRDAPEVGLRASEIAWGSLAFAATFSRPVVGGSCADAATISRRARLSIALSTSAAILALSHYASAPLNAQVGQDVLSMAVGATWALLTFYAIVAPVAATFAVLATRGMTWRVRVAVLLSSVVSAVPLAQRTIVDWIYTSPFGPLYLALGTIAAPAVGALVVLVAVTVWRRRQPLDTAPTGARTAVRVLHSSLAGALVALLVSGGYVGATGLWAARDPLVFGYPVTDSNRAAFDQWLEVNAWVEQMVSTTFALWIGVGLVIALAIALSGLSRRSTLRRTAGLCVGALSVVLLSLGALVSFLQLVLPSIGSGYAMALVTELGQVGLLILVLVAAGKWQGQDSSDQEKGVAVGLGGSAKVGRYVR